MMNNPPIILVVDDIVENVAVLAEILSDGFDVRFATSGPEALALIARSPPDLILLDVVMPDMDGYQVCALLKRDPETRDLPVIFVTARDDAASESRALAAGAVDFIHKPVNRDVVRARVGLQVALRSRELETRELHARLDALLAQRIGTPAGSPAGSPARASAAALATTGACAQVVPGARILVAEDNPISRMMIVAQLEQAGCVVDTAHDGAAAVDMVRGNPRYDLVLMDLLMPAMDGLDATREIRKLPHGDDLPVLAMNPGPVEQDRERCLDAGMNDLLAKPLDPAEFWPKLNLWVTRHRECDRPVPDPAAGRGLPSGVLPLEEIPGLEIRTGLRQALGRTVLYLSLLERFVTGQRDFQDRMLAALRVGDLETAERLARTLKGAASQVGAIDLKDRAECLVLAIRRREVAEAVREAAAETAGALRALTEAIAMRLPQFRRRAAVPAASDGLGDAARLRGIRG